MLRTGQLPPRSIVAALAALGVLLASPGSGLANKVHWKDAPDMPGCSALAFDDTDEWFANEAGAAFKRGICHGQRIPFKVTLAPDRENFTVAGTNFCSFHVGDNDEITAGCRPNRRK